MHRCYAIVSQDLREAAARLAAATGRTATVSWVSGDSRRTSRRESIWFSGAPGRSRTCDPRIRSPMLYPAELQARAGILAGYGAGVKCGGVCYARNYARQLPRHVLAGGGAHHVADDRSPKVVTQAPRNAPFSRAVAHAFRKSLIRCPLSRPERCGNKYGTIRPVCRSSARTRSTWAATKIGRAHV